MTMYMMAHSPQISPRQPKIRSSCDGCGAVKVKCDRQRPECGRCMAHGITCTYSISRKIGKPRQDRFANNGSNNSNNNNNSSSSSNNKTGSSTSISTMASTNTSTGSESTSASTSVSTSASTNTSNSLDSIMSYNWHSGDAMDDDDSHSNGNNNDNDHNMFHTDYGFPDEMSSTTFSSNFLPSLAFGDWMVPDHFDTVTPSVHHFETYEKLDLSGHDSNGQQRSDMGSSHSGSPPHGGKAHDCHREAHELLGSSLFTYPNPNPDSTQHTESVAASPSVHAGVVSGPAHAATSYFENSNVSMQGVALDQVLLLNRKATERLASLLACSCAASPYLMILYASLISAVLTRYQHAAGSSSTWNSLAASGRSVAPASISIGAFRVDDPRIQSALNIQLLAGELRTVAGLIDMIASFGCNNKVMGEQSAGTNVLRLYQSLAMWLRGEHSRVTNMIRSRLTRLNT